LDWPKTNGNVIKSSIEASKGSSSTGSSGGTVVWHADIAYEYTVDGQSYNNYKVSYGDYGSSDKSHAQAILNRYPLGKKVPVYYQPDDQSESVLEPEGTKQGIMLKIIIGSAFMFIGAIIALIPYVVPKIKRRIGQQS